MPRLIGLYIRQCAIGFAVSAAFVALLLWFDVAGLSRLVFASDMAVVAILMLWVMNGIVFAGVQFAWAVMSMAERDETPRGGKRLRLEPVPVKVGAEKRRDHQTTVGY
ncbi:hypothetical protein [Seohaeicola zhoushanensis]|uniref:Uncharacterized protein n=1 Tax=Seohaeicola zhoushanensis TaxID=1569283 RepID=A0A8J3H1D4_9RHOB|nr:hypothetical protein [Seohaeicola zhoushanensis]GHF63768.1 hypothetical protein GCM10017056_38880 [Seohaeicola zhoushanensis]